MKKIYIPVLTECDACKGTGSMNSNGYGFNCFGCGGKGVVPDKMLLEDLLKEVAKISNSSGSIIIHEEGPEDERPF